MHHVIYFILESNRWSVNLDVILYGGIQRLQGCGWWHASHARAWDPCVLCARPARLPTQRPAPVAVGPALRASARLLRLRRTGSCLCKRWVFPNILSGCHYQ